MAKNAVYATDRLWGFSADPFLKRIALGFDTIYVDQPHIWWTDADLSAPNMAASAARIREDQVLYPYLLEHKVISFVDVPWERDMDNLSELERIYLQNSEYHIQESFPLADRLGKSKDARESDALSKTMKGLVAKASDSLTRYKASRLQRLHAEEFYPVLQSDDSFDQDGVKTAVVRMVLNNLPQPDENTPWEAIIDFRRDDETRRQYLALMNWINEMGHSPLSANEIAEKLEFLLLDYKKSTQRHRLKWKTGFLEIFSAATVGFFTGNLPAVLNLVSNFIKIGSTVVNLREEEGKLPGKEIAYIYRANQAF